MGNLCGKESKSNFEGQGRTLGSAPAPVTKASVPNNVATSKPKVGGPPRTLGEGNSGGDAKSAAAAAAEAEDDEDVDIDRRNIGLRKWMMPKVLGRTKGIDLAIGETQTLSFVQARANKVVSGDLQKKLDAQKRQTNNQTLQQAANENRLAREADQATETRNYN